MASSSWGAKLLKDADVDSILLINSEMLPDFSFLKYSKAKMGTLTGSFMLVTRSGIELFSSPLDYGSARKVANAEVHMFSSRKELKKLLEKRVKGKKVGLNYEGLVAKSLPKVKKLVSGTKFADVSEALRKEREIKSKGEIRKIRKACKITEKVIEDTVSEVKAGDRELDVAKELEAQVLKHGGEGVSFPVIVAAGKNSAVPHHVTAKTKIKKGDLLLIDIGVRYENYTSDVSRVYSVGNAGTAQEEFYSAVYESLQCALKKAGKGVAASELFCCAEDVLRENSGQKLIHALGHGIGLQDHDTPGGIGGKSKWNLKEGMVLAIEPAVYFKGVGGVRIEDNLVVTGKGCSRMSHAPKELIRI